MGSKCPICGKEVQESEGSGRPRVYCSLSCKQKAYIDAKRRQWAYREAEKLAEIVITTGGEYIDNLGDYIYNNYNKRKGK